MEDLSGSGATIPANMRAAQFPVQKAAKATEPEQIEARQAAIAKFQQQLLVRVCVFFFVGTYAYMHS